jgi:hypothetical protein
MLKDEVVICVGLISRCLSLMILRIFEYLSLREDAFFLGGRHGCMIVGFTTTCAISAYHH